MGSNNFDSGCTVSRVWNAGKETLKALRSGGLFILGPTRTSKPPRYWCRTSNSSTSLTEENASGGKITLRRVASILALGIYLFTPHLTDSLAIASQEETSFAGLSKPPFDINRVIEKAEHLPVLKEGYYIVEDPTYTAMFTPRGVIYTPVIPGGLTLDPFSLRVSQIGTSSGEIFWSENKVTMPLQKENTLVYKRTQDIEEVYDIRSKGVEQSWVFRRNPGFSVSSDLRIIMDVKTSLTGQATPQMGLEFVDEEGTPYVKYSKAVIIDADGKVLETPPYWDAANSRIVLNISGEWLAAAAYPVIVDPVLNTADIAVDTLSTANESYPAVAFDGTNYLVVYQSGTPNATGTGSTDIKGVRVSAVDGTIVGTTISIAATASRDEEHPYVAYDPAYTRYLVVWERWTSGTASDVMLNTVTTGGAVGTAVAVSVGGTRILAYPSIACCDATNAYLVWGRANTAGSSRITGLRGALINKQTLGITNTSPSGTLTNTGGPTSSPTTAPAVSPKIIFANTTPNRYFLVWEDFTDTNGDLKAQIYTVGTGWGAQWIVANTGALLERYPSPAFDGTNFLIAYQRGATGGSADIYGQFATTAGANQGAAFTISATVGQDEVTPGLAWVTGTCSATPINRYLAVWGQGTTIQARPITTAGALEATLTVSVNTASTKVNPAIAAYEGGCGYFVAWSDNRNGGGTPYDIYAQRVGYPNISNLTGPLGSPSGEVGQTISINGLNFGSDPGAGNRSTATNNIKINGAQVSEAGITSWSDTVINFTIPTGTTPGTYPVTVTSAGWTSNSSNLTVTNALQITTASLTAGHQWLSYSAGPLAASGGTPPYSNWQIVFGALPAGLTLDSNTGVISGTPTGAEALETVSFTVQVSDSLSATATKDLSITIYKLTSITITDTGGTPVSPTINYGGTFQFKARGTYSDLLQVDISGISPLQWKSSNPTVATIGLTTGLATGSGAGTATICAVTEGESCP